MMNISQPNIVEIATQNLEKLTSLRVKMEVDKPFMNALRSSDGVISISWEDREELLWAVEKSEIRSPGTLMASVIRRFGIDSINGALVVANYITPEMKDYLKNNNLNYLETAGNCHIKRGGLFIHINGEKTLDYRQPASGKAFQATGMKTILAILVQSNLLNQSYRKIAEIANVSLGSIGSILEDLRSEGFIALKNKDKVLVNREELITKWIELYPYVLRPKQFVGTYKCIESGCHFNENESYAFSGRVESERECFTLYTDVDKRNLKSTFGLVKDKEGGIEVLKPFWKPETTIFINPDRSTHPILDLGDTIGTQRPMVDDDLIEQIKSRIQISN